MFKNGKESKIAKAGKVTPLLLVVVAAVIMLPVLLGSCGSPLGFGKPIDWEPPVLTLDGNENPRYVGLGAYLSGTVRDNIGVDRVILREAGKTEEIFEAALLPDNRWHIDLVFDESRNGEKLAVEVVAFDSMGNSGETSIRAITLIIDITPPIVEGMAILRADDRKAYPRTYTFLKNLEEDVTIDGAISLAKDKEGRNSDFVEEYQNGYFYITGQVNEEETRITDIKLNIYDFDDHDDIPLLTLEPLPGSFNSPKWLLWEEGQNIVINGDTVLGKGLITAGVDKHGGSYADDYYYNGKRFYYRLEIQATDKGDNTSVDALNYIKQTAGYFCLWETADEPKGIVDPGVGTAVQGGATIPIEFFDDDTIEYAYAGMLTQDQWNGVKNIASGGPIPQNGTDNDKLEWLRDRLLNKTGPVYDWHFDVYNGALIHEGKSTEVTELIGYPDKTAKEVYEYIITGQNTLDYGKFFLFTIVKDKKMPPHPSVSATGRPTTAGREKLRLWEISVIDENQPLIVLDTVDTTDPSYQNEMGSHLGGPTLETIDDAQTGDSPEENTFPTLKESPDYPGTGGRVFEINGYTLRATKVNNAENPDVVENRVVKFRMAWIPYGIQGGAESKVEEVKIALRAINYPDSFGSYISGNLAGIQHWNFVPQGTTPKAGESVLIMGSKQDINGAFQKQVFRKQFDILGGVDDLKNGLNDTPLYENFRYNGVLENETKLFVLYAEDNMGNRIERQVRFLGNKTPPTLTVYDITKKPLATPEDLPNLVNDGKYYVNGVITEATRRQYQNDLAGFQPTTYPDLRGLAYPGGTFALNDDDISPAYWSYPRGTLLKYWVTAERKGGLAISNIKMQDITYKLPQGLTEYPPTGSYNGNNQITYGNDRSLSYIETLPEVDQRVFLFTATDTLGNIATLQRTIAITNGAVLNNITTVKQSGTYGMTKKTPSPPNDPIDPITLQANFSNLIKWTGTNPPELNVRYMNQDGDVVIAHIPTKTPANTAVLALEFDFVVEENYGGILETMYRGIVNNSVYPNGTTQPQGTDGDKDNRPIRIPTGTEIRDNTRGDLAFTPGNSLGFDWTGNQGQVSSLQGRKEILLDGKRPTLTAFAFNVPSGKTAYRDGGTIDKYYFKSAEKVEFTITANKDIESKTGSTPVLQFTVGASGTLYTASWQRSPTARTMVFAALVDSQPDGSLDNYAIQNAGNIIDSYGNELGAGVKSVPALANVTVIIDQTPPIAPPTFLQRGAQTAENITAITNTDYNASPTLTITRTDDGSGIAPVKTEYSLDGGGTWVEFPNARATWTTVKDTTSLNILNGQWILQTRFTDRAGNIGTVASKAIHVNAKFPDLKTIVAVQPSGIYGTNRTLQFDLTFDAVVWTNTEAGDGSTTATITLTNRNTIANNTAANTAANTNNKGGRVTPIYEQVLTATTVTKANANTKIRFEWNSITGKEMLDGLYISAVNFTGLRDYFGNSGGSGTASFSGSPTALSIAIPGYDTPNTCTNLSGANLKVDCLGPVVTGRTPANADGLGNNKTTSVSADNKTITLTFDEPVQRGRGTITVRPHGNYAIPAVIENDGYYLTVTYPTNTTQTETKSSTAGTNSTYVSGMNDIFNNMPSSPATDRNYLIGSSSLGSPALSDYTGLSVGPYKKMTHGLKTGLGYTGAYSSQAGNTAPSPSQANSMIPDTATKWVLAYNYEIHSTSQSEVTNIRSALTRVGFRRQDIAVTSTANVAVSGNTVTITLSEPLLPGLQWGLFYPAGTFTDLAGNSAPATGPDLSESANILSDSTYWFWSRGVQKPVIRVDRKSYDARNPSNGAIATVPIYNPAESNTRQNPPTNDANAINGTIGSYNTVAYRIESETPGARIYYGTQTGAANTGSATGAWTGDAGSGRQWGGPKTNNAGSGTWVQNNLVFRNSNTESFTVSENGITVTHNIRGNASTAGGTFAANYYGFRSFNRDALENELNGTASNNPVNLNNNAANNYTGSFSYNVSGLQASKNYVAADARVDHVNATYTTATYTSQRGYEGVFRTVIALNQNGLTTASPNPAPYILLLGTNVKSGMPTIAGFPVRDGVANGDTRYLKMFNRDQKHFYWVSTEIVTSWYMQTRGNGSAYSTVAGTNPGGSGYGNSGDSTDWITAGYGDLSYGFDVTSN